MSPRERTKREPGEGVGGTTDADGPRIDARSPHRRLPAGRVVVALSFLASLGLLLAVAPEALAAAGNDVAKNLGDLLRGYAAQIYGGVLAIVSLIFLINRRYIELMTFLVAAVVVGWMVFSPDAIAKAARAIGKQILG